MWRKKGESFDGVDLHLNGNKSLLSGSVGEQSCEDEGGPALLSASRGESDCSFRTSPSSICQRASSSTSLHVCQSCLHRLNARGGADTEEQPLFKMWNIPGVRRGRLLEKKLL